VAGVLSLFEGLHPECVIGGRLAVRIRRIEVVEVRVVFNVVSWMV